MDIWLIVTTYNRNNYWRDCLQSLINADLSGVQVLVIDDASTNIDMSGLPSGWMALTKKERKGIKDSLYFGIQTAFNRGAKTVINLDGDALVSRDFIERLMWLHEKYPHSIVGGFHSRTMSGGKLINPIVEEMEGYVMRGYINGINMCFGRAAFEAVILPALEAAGNWDSACSTAAPFPTLVPSVVEHIGLESSMGHHLGRKPDVAYDFKMLNLPDVTLFGIDRVNKKGIEAAAEISRRQINFGAEVIITDHDYWGGAEGREGYSRFCIKGMGEFVNTSHVLIIHPDGYVQRPLSWTDEFLEYDYIGAKWAYDRNNVGNGGFSLRSKKLLNALLELDIEKYHPEDDIICRKLGPTLEFDFGIKFANDDLADRFSIEGYFGNGGKKNYSGSFGFHGYGINGLIHPIRKYGK